MKEDIKNGDVYNIGQTVNGVDTFLWFNNKWYYFTERLSSEYEYDQSELTDTVNNVSGLEDIQFVRNILKQ
tara:strand:- start:360 stop:572 length:213 start_codon:yes stop_codon:yes gene_type:complete